MLGTEKDAMMAKGYELAETIRHIEAAKHVQAASAKLAMQSMAKSSVSESSSSTAEKSQLTAEVCDQFCAKNRCFYCCEVRHSKHNCPLLHEASAPKVRSAVATVSNNCYASLQSLSVDDLDKKVQVGCE